MSISTASPVTIERADLYDLVWQEPMTKIAPRFGLSDVGLAKACNRNNIPRPPAGYWAQKAVGKAPRRTPLPPVKDGEAKSITFLADERPKPLRLESQSDRVKDEQLKALIAFEEQPENKITIVENPSRFHEIVRATKASFSGRSTGRLGARLYVDVAKESLPRAFRLMDALVKAFEKRGHKVVIEQGKGQYDVNEVLFVVLEEKYRVSLREKKKMIRIPESERDRVYGNRVRHEYNGLFELQLWRKQSGYDGARWIDGVKSKVENRLNAIMIEFLVCVEKDRDWRRIQQERAVEARAAEIRRWEQQVERQKQEQKINELNQKIEKWEQAARIRAFIADARATNEGRGQPIEEGSELDLYLAWAMKHADAIDPLGTERKPQSVIATANVDWERPFQPR